MFLLDTDHMSLLEYGGEECRRIQQRLRSVPLDEVATTIISYEEQTRGWMARIAQAPTPERQLRAYFELKRQLNNYCKIAIVEYDAKAIEVYAHLRQAHVRIGTMDLKIAAIALANDAILLTRNFADFAKVPNLKFDDWSQ